MAPLRTFGSTDLKRQYGSFARAQTFRQPSTRRWPKLEHYAPDEITELAVLRAAIDDGDASGVAEGDVFAQVRETLNLPATKGAPRPDTP
jgi:hypothetical protein